MCSCLMVVDNLNVRCMSIVPGKTDAPLVVHPNAILACAIATKRFQLITGRNPEIVQFVRGTDYEQLFPGFSLQPWIEVLDLYP